jgi:hypothetical protein
MHCSRLPRCRARADQSQQSGSGEQQARPAERKGRRQGSLQSGRRRCVDEQEFAKDSVAIVPDDPRSNGAGSRRRRPISNDSAATTARPMDKHSNGSQ